MRIPFAKGRLKRAIEEGLGNGKLRDELEELGDVVIKSRADAEAICWGLEQIDHIDPRVSQEHTYALAGLFQEVDGGDCAATEIDASNAPPHPCSLPTQKKLKRGPT